MKRSQASTQSVLIYALAFLIFIIIIVLFWLGFLHPDRYLPNACTLPVGMLCVDSVAKTSHISIVVMNPKNDPMYIKDISVQKAEGCELMRFYSSGTGPNGTQFLGPGEQKEFVLIGCNFPHDFTGTDITIEYYTDQGLLYKDTGYYRHEVEKSFEVDPSSNQDIEVCKKADILEKKGACSWLKDSHPDVFQKCKDENLCQDT